MSGHPPAPWRLRGPAVIVPALVPMERAREHVPERAAVIPVVPGGTLGGLVSVTYEHGSTLSYNELVVICGLARVGARVGFWVSHIWVDDERSVSGGREIWKLPKELATFDSTAAHPAVRIAATAPRFKLRQPGLVPMLSAGGLTLGRGTMRGGPARVRVEIPPGSEFADLGMRPLSLGLAGYADLTMPAPK
jgi:hypothetical protein